MKRGFWFTDKERSPFGLGWEYARRGKEISDNPFSKTDNVKNWRLFQLGFIKYIPSPTADYAQQLPCEA